MENDIYQYTKQIDSEPILINYDVTSDEDLTWGFGLGCNGSVTIILEKLNFSTNLSPLNLITQCLRQKKNGEIATIFSTNGNINLKIGSRLIIYPDDTIQSDIHWEELQQAIILTTKNTHHSSVIKYQLPSGTVEVFIEIIQPPISLIIFGAGRDALPVVQLAKIIGWEVTVVDCCAQQQTYQRFAISDKIILTRHSSRNYP